MASLLPVGGQVPAAPPGASNPGSLPAKETLDYSIEWRLVTAGHAQLEWYATTPKLHMGYEAKLHLESVGLVSRLYKRERSLYRGNDPHAVRRVHGDERARRQPQSRNPRTLRSGRPQSHYVERDLNKNTIFSQRETPIPGCVYDVLGGLAAIRAIQLEPGHSTEFHMSDGKKSVSAKIEAEKREEIKTNAGTFKTIRYQAYLFNDVLFHRSAHLYIWLSDDARKLPVQIQIRLQIAIGTITFKLDKESR